MARRLNGGRKLLAAIGALLAICGCGGPRTEVERIGEDYWQASLRRFPSSATYKGDHRYDDRLEDLSQQAAIDWNNAQAGYLARLSSLDDAGLTEADRLNKAILQRQLTDAQEEFRCKNYLKPLSHQSGPHIGFPMLLVSHPFRTERDYRNYVARLDAFPAQVDQLIDCLDKGIAEGHVPPRIIVEKTIPQMAVHIVARPEESVFYAPVGKFPAGISQRKRADLTEAIRTAIATRVVPAYRHLQHYVQGTYLPACRDTVGIWAEPDGDAIYDILARVHTTTDMTPEEIHEVGVKEIARIRGEMEKVKAEMGFAGPLDAFIDHMRTDPSYRAASAEALLAEFRATLDWARPRMTQLFGRLPKAPVEIKEMEAFRAPAAPAAYAYPPPEDGSRPGYFYVNTYKAEERPTYTKEALTFHEALPGHHFQMSLDIENKHLPHFRRYSDFTAYIEGWGLYSESLGAEIGGYADPASRFGRLTFDAWRAARLVVDTGIHRKRWPREQSVAYMRQNTGLSEVDINSEIDRYIAWTGQALAYKIGELVIHRLRHEAELALVDRFDVRAFDDTLLAEGAQPL